jgi:cytochrome P450 family 49 subfamily A
VLFIIKRIIDRHGEGWYSFRSKVQQVMLQPRTARMYTKTIDDASQAFIER